MLKAHRRKKTSKRVLALPDLELVKTAVLNTLTSATAKRTYDHAITEFVGWYCSEPVSRSIAPSSCAIASISKNGTTLRRPSISVSPPFGVSPTRRRMLDC